MAETEEESAKLTIAEPTASLKSESPNAFDDNETREKDVSSGLERLLLRITEAPRVWTRAAAILSPQDSVWRLARLEVITGEAPESWDETCWEYESAVLSAHSVTGTTVARWFIEKRIGIGSVTVPFSVDSEVRPERRDSKAGGVFEPLQWPSVAWTTQANDRPSGAMNGVLVAADNPAFLNFDQAASALFAIPKQTNHRFDAHDVVFREQDLRARIEHVHIKAAEALVTVGGSNLGGKHLTISGANGATAELTPDRHEISLALPTGLPEGAWLALYEGRQLIDSRALDPSWRPPSDVEFDIEGSTRIEARISRGEGVDLELKRELPGSDPRNVMKTVAAFANGNGGTLLFGVDDGLQLLGLGDALTRDAIDDLTRRISDHVHPHPLFDIEQITIKHIDILAVHVAAGPETPYGVGTTDRKLTYYVRRGANSSPARPEDIRRAVHSRVTI